MKQTKEDPEELVSTNDEENGNLRGQVLFDDVYNCLLGKGSNGQAIS